MRDVPWQTPPEALDQPLVVVICVIKESRYPRKWITRVFHHLANRLNYISFSRIYKTLKATKIFNFSIISNFKAGSGSHESGFWSVQDPLIPRHRGQNWVFSAEMAVQGLQKWLATQFCDL